MNIKRFGKRSSKAELIKELSLGLGFDEIPKCLCPAIVGGEAYARIDYCTLRCNTLCNDFLTLSFVEKNDYDLHSTKLFIKAVRETFIDRAVDYERQWMMTYPIGKSEKSSDIRLRKQRRLEKNVRQSVKNKKHKTRKKYLKTI